MVEPPCSSSLADPAPQSSSERKDSENLKMAQVECEPDSQAVIGRRFGRCCWELSCVTITLQIIALERTAYMSKLLLNLDAPKSPQIIGMVHLRPLPGTPQFDGDFQAVIDSAVADAIALAAGGVDAVMMENFGDVPFYPGRVPAITVAAMSVAVRQIRQAIDVPLGVNVLRNDGESALAIAVATGASFIRVNVLPGARVTDQGLIQGIAHDLLRLRLELRANEIQILADVDVKHSAALAVRPFQDELADLMHRGGADAVIVSGSGTGSETSMQQISDALQIADGLPILVGSGVTVESLATMPSGISGFIVGTSFKHEGHAHQPVDQERVASFVRATRERWN